MGVLNRTIDAYLKTDVADRADTDFSDVRVLASQILDLHNGLCCYEVFTNVQETQQTLH